MVESKTADTDGKGIPLKSSYPANIPVPVLYTILNGVFLAIGVAVAYFMILPSTPAANVKIQLLASHDLGWIYMGAYALKVGQVMMNTNLGIRRKACKVNVPDQQVYKVKGAGGSSLGYVLMESEGDLGAFNRAQRALQNYNEIYPQFVLYFLLAGFVFPFGTFLCAALFGVARVFTAIGYTSAPDSRMPGNMMGFLVLAVLEGMVLVSGILAVQASSQPLA